MIDVGSTINYFNAKGDSIAPSSNLLTTLYTYDAAGNVEKIA